MSLLVASLLAYQGVQNFAVYSAAKAYSKMNWASRYPPDSETQVALHSGFHDPGEGSASRASRCRFENLHPRRLQARIFHGRLRTPPAIKATVSHPATIVENSGFI